MGKPKVRLANMTFVRPTLTFPSSHPQPGDQGHLGNHVSRTTYQNGCGHGDFAPHWGYSSIISAEHLEKKSVEGILLRSRMAQSLEVWIQKNKETCIFFFSDSHQNEKLSKCSLGGLKLLCFPKCYSVGNTNIQ